MADALNEKLVRALLAPATGNHVHYDGLVKGFGCRVTRAGAKAFVLNYAVGGRERRLTIGSYPDWSVQAARDEAKRLKRQVDVGEDPMAERHAERAAPTVADVAGRFMAEHAIRRRPKTASEYESMVRLYILREFGTRRLATLTKADIQRLHDRVVAKFPYRANRIVNLLATLINWSGERADNPAQEVKLAPEEGRERFLTVGEIDRVCDALDRLPVKASADAIRLMMLTGARKMEACAAQWREFELEGGSWTRTAGKTKAGKRHTVPLSDAAVELLRALRQEAVRGDLPSGPDDYVFPGDGVSGHLADVKSAWRRVTMEAGLGRYFEALDVPGRVRRKWVADVRPHDLRHTFASLAASNSHSLPVVGRLLGQSRQASTARYAHLADATLRTTVNQVGEAVLGRRRRAGQGKPP